MKKRCPCDKQCTEQEEKETVEYVAIVRKIHEYSKYFRLRERIKQLYEHVY